MDILSLIGGIFKPATELVDNLTTSDQERLELKNELTKIQNEMLSNVFDLQGKMLESQSAIAVAETSSESKLTRSVRPILLLILVSLIIAGSFNLCVIDEKIYDIIQMLLGTYVGGRSVEKIASIVKG